MMRRLRPSASGAGHEAIPVGRAVAHGGIWEVGGVVDGQPADVVDVQVAADDDVDLGGVTPASSRAEGRPPPLPHPRSTAPRPASMSTVVSPLRSRKQPIGMCTRPSAANMSWCVAKSRPT